MKTKETEMMIDSVISNVRGTSAIVDLLFDLGYNNNVELFDNKLKCVQNNMYFYPRDFQVDHIFHITGLGYIYGLSNSVFNFKGILAIYLNGEVVLK